MILADLLALLRARGVDLSIDEHGEGRVRGWGKLMPHEREQLKAAKAQVAELLMEPLVEPPAGNNQTATSEPAPTGRIVGQQRQADGTWQPIYEQSARQAPTDRRWLWQHSRRGRQHEDGLSWPAAEVPPWHQ